MNTQEFLHRFQFSSPQSHSGPPMLSHLPNPRKSAVLIPLVERNNQLEVILTTRAKHLRHHAGQVSFPGGKVEPDDNSPVDTALRETYEEIGVDAKYVTVIGQLPEYLTMTGFSISPVLALIDSRCTFSIDANEVDEVFHVPLSYFTQTHLHTTVEVKRDTVSYPVHFMPYQGYNIWGATAAILKDLANHIR